MTPFEWLIIIKLSDFLAILKNIKKILKNIKFGSKLDFHMKNILTGRIDYLIKILLINVYHGGQILNTSSGVDYNIHVACTFLADETINLHDLKMKIMLVWSYSLANSASILVHGSTLHQ
jgi:hypothetical protein